MTTRLLRAAASFGCGGWNSFLEFEAPQGVPDVVFARLAPEAIAARRKTPLARPLISSREAAVVFALDTRRPKTLTQVSVRARMSEATTRATLRLLLAADAVETNGASWRLSAAYPSPLLEAVAVELKLSDWRRALGQAVRYNGFADRSFVVVSEAHAAPAAARANAFRLHCVGLASLSPWGEIAFLTRPRRRSPRDAVARFVAGERLWKAYERVGSLNEIAA